MGATLFNHDAVLGLAMVGHRQESKSGHQRVEDLMRRQAVTIQPGASLVVAAERMRRHDVGCLPVIEGDKVIGMITDRDIVLRSVAENLDASRTTVQQSMSGGPMFCRVDDAVDRVKQRMVDHQVKRLPVLNRHDRLVGIISFGDITEHRPKCRPSKVTFYKKICDPTGHQHKVAVATVFLSPAVGKDDKAMTAINQLKRRRKVEPWAGLADTYDIEIDAPQSAT